jgi:hypothetical protein
MLFVGIVETGLVSGTYYSVGGSDWCQTNDDIDFVTFREHSALLFERTSKAVLSTCTFLWGKIFDAKGGGRNKNNSGLRGLVNIEITKSLNYSMSICVLHIKFHVRWNSADSLRHSYRELSRKMWCMDDHICRHWWHYKIGFFSEAAFIFKLSFTAWYWAVLHTFCLYIPLQLSWQPTPLASLLSRHVASRRVVCEVRIKSLCMVSYTVWSDALGTRF